MSRLAQLTSLGFALAAAFLASAPLMLLLYRTADFDSNTVVAAALVTALIVPMLMALLCWRLIRFWQPQSMWLVAVSSGLALAALAAWSL